MKKIKIPFLKPGKFTSMSGEIVEIDKSTLDKIIEATKNFAYQDDDFPLVIGHPKTDDPAWGWVKKTNIVKEDDVLVALAEHEDLVPEFKDWFGKKLFKKVSVKLRPDFSIQHIGFLGAKAPAVTGLPSVAFKAEEQGVTIEFSELEISKWYFTSLQRIFRGLKNLLIEKYSKEEADAVLNEYDLESLAEPPYIFPKAEEAVASHSFSTEKNNITNLTNEEEMKLEDLEKQVKELAESLKAKDAEIATLKNEKAGIAQQLDAKVLEQKRNEFAAFCSSDDVKKKVKDGEVTEIVETLLSLDQIKAVEFGEGENKKTITPVESFKSLLKRLPDVVELGEHTDRSKADTTDGVDVSEFEGKNIDKDRLELHKRAKAFAEKENVAYEVALEKVRK